MGYFMLRGIAILCTLLAASSCDESKMRSNGDARNTADNMPAVGLSAPCSPSGEPSTPNQKVPRRPASKYSFTGEVCPKGLGSTSVLFIVDFSQSMEFPADLADRFGKGNDPRNNGSCARLEAAMAVVNNIQSRLAKGDQVDVSVVPFSSEVIEEAKLTKVPLGEFSSNLNPKYFCGTESLTNYAAGFAEANKILASSSAQYKVIYFITDGKPYIEKVDENGDPVPRTDGLEGSQVDGPKAQQQGREKMSALRAAHPNLNFYSLFLGNQVEDPQEAVNYLNEISGKENVKVATEASKLAEEIVKFSLPGLAIEPNSVVVKLDDKQIPVKRVSPSQKGNSIWEIETNEFSLGGEDSVITIEGKTVSGKPVAMGATITLQEPPP